MAEIGAGGGAAEAGGTVKELTLRGIILGALLTVVLTAANVYAGLKIGLTVATSIPAAVISMAVLRSFTGSTIQENNIVQTIASAAGTLSGIVFVLPGLIMVGWWTDFPFWLSSAIIAVGGLLGVFYSVPLRRALVTGTDLPFPEGVAAGEVLKVGTGVGGADENRRGLRMIVWSSVASAAFAALAQTRLLVGEVAKAFKFGGGATAASATLSMLLIGVGHLVGLAVGIAMLVGIVISWVFLVPHFTELAAQPTGTDLLAFVNDVFRAKVRFVGAGAMGVAAVWTLLKIIGPIVKGVSDALKANRARKSGQSADLPLTERDLPIGIIGLSVAVLLVPIALMLWAFSGTPPISANPATAIGVAVIYIVLAGVVVAAVTGYMAGLIGASNSPLSGIGILSALGIALILVLLFPGVSGDSAKPLVAFALFITAFIFGIGTIANNNLQDLKTGQLVGATPWRQQVALLLGVVFGTVVIPPVLNLLNVAFGFQGAPGAGANALAAPQAALISAITQGVLGGNLDWNLIGLGAAIGVGMVIVDELLRLTKKGSLPPLAVGMGIYLPMTLNALTVAGAVMGHFYNRWSRRQANPEFAERMGVLLATGLIVGESLFGVVFAGLVAATGKDAPLALVEEFPLAVPLSVIVFTAVILGFYAWTRREAATAAATGEQGTIADEATYR